MLWWSKELCALRTKTRSSFNAWSRTMLISDRLFYRRSMSGYQRALRQAKCKAWATSGKVLRLVTPLKSSPPYLIKLNPSPFLLNLLLMVPHLLIQLALLRSAPVTFSPMIYHLQVHPATFETARSALNLMNSEIPPMSD